MTVRRAPYAHVVHLQRTETCTDLGIEVAGNLVSEGCVMRCIGNRGTGIIPAENTGES